MKINYDIRGVYARFIILIFEDVPMIVLNARLMMEYNYSDRVMILSQLCSAALAGSKVRSVIYLRNLYKERNRLRKVVAEEKNRKTIIITLKAKRDKKSKNSTYHMLCRVTYVSYMFIKMSFN